jgi:hypothetical protein
VNEEGEFSVLKLATGKYDLIEREEIDKRLKNISYKMIKLVMIYIYLNSIYMYVYMYVFMYLYMNIFFSIYIEGRRTYEDK